jgi:hypothetical protein
MAEVQRPGRLSGGQRVAVGVSVALGLGLATYGVAGSYQTVSGLAERRGVPLAPLVPVGIDGGLIGVVVLDLMLSWIGQPIGWLRQFVRILTVGTVAANAADGWPDAVAAGLHVAAPLMLLAMVEAGRALAAARGIGNRQGEALALYTLGKIQNDTGQITPARKSWQHALAIFEELGAPQAAEVHARLETAKPPPGSKPSTETTRTPMITYDVVRNWVITDEA